MKHSPTGRTKVILLRCDQDEYDAILHTATTHGMTMAEYLRTLGTTEVFCQRLQWLQTAIESDIPLERRASIIHAAVTAFEAAKEAVHTLEQIITPAYQAVLEAMHQVGTRTK